ncbi:GNAT family N-acetyltransferase [Nocardiopsis mangrovi]|uniref:GNAT family N-acetyltransferase n=1 Tax=Nocardiopsis mangrovi TaxID=1179818 RepID=A0ABV9E2L5_9ACTN
MFSAAQDPRGDAEPVPLTGERVSLRPWEPGDGPELNRIVALPEVWRWWNGEDFTAPADHARRYVVLVDSAVRGMIQFYEESEPGYRHAGIDLFIDPALRGRGLGVDAIRLLAGWLFTERGHHRLVIDPALGNDAAVRAYEKAGFRRVGVLREYWLDHVDGAWRDGLLMDLLRSDPAAAGPARG